MAKKNDLKQVSFTKIDEYLKDISDEAFEYKPTKLNYPCENGTKELDVQIRRSIPLFEIGCFVEDVVSACFVSIDSEDGGTKTRYAPYYKDLYVFKNILKYYTNIKPIDTFGRLEKIATVGGYSVVGDVMGKINQAQFSQIMKYVDELIDFKKQELLNHKTSNLDTLVDNINSIVLNINDIVLKVADKVDDVDLSEISQYIPSITNALSSGEFDAEKIAKAFTELKSNHIEGEGLMENNHDDGKIINIDSLKE